MACLPVPKKRPSSHPSPLSHPLDMTSFSSADDYMAYVREEAGGYDGVQLARPEELAAAAAAAAEASSEASSSSSSSSLSLNAAPPRTSQNSSSHSSHLSSSTPSLLLPLLSSSSSFPPYPSSRSAPSSSWLSHAHREFLSLQRYMLSIPISKTNPPTPAPPASTISLPPHKDFITWNLLLLPSPERTGPDFKNLYTDPSTRVEYDIFTDTKYVRPVPAGLFLPPTPPLLLRMDHVMRMVILRHLSRPLSFYQTVTPFTLLQDLPHRLLWIYSLLSCVEPPLQIDAAAELRGLARSLGAVRVLVGEKGEEGARVGGAIDGALVALVRVYGCASEGEAWG